jgi:pyridoxamine 5'-phosphate oxidase family protein
MFTEKEIAYLRSQRLARIGTVSADGEPDVAAVAFTFDGHRFFVGGIDVKRTLKYKNAKATGRAALVVDDYPSMNPPQPRGIKIHGKACIVQAEGYAGPGEYIEITPERSWSWGVEAPAFDQGKPVIKKVRIQGREK